MMIEAVPAAPLSHLFRGAGVERPAGMLPSDFIDHLTRKGVLREAPMPGGAPGRRGSAAETDWLGLTRLTQSTFADELAAFYGCNRARRSDLVGGRFAGQKISARFLRERRLFPFENRSGTLALAVAVPTEGETVRAVELALRRLVALTVATGEKSSATAPADTAVADETLAALVVALDERRRARRALSIAIEGKRLVVRSGAAGKPRCLRALWRRSAA
jgi:hypothetical protein